MSLICDNAPVNARTFELMGGPGKVSIQYKGDTYNLFLVYVHIHKNITNNWITEINRQLSFTTNGEKYLACWSDVIALYEEDRKSAIRLTKLTNTSVHTKPLQRQSVPLVSQVFNDKTVAASKALKGSVKYNEGTVIFIQLVTDWFKMTNVKDKYTAIRLRDELRSPWELNCVSFTKLMYTCNIINCCKRGRGGKRIQTLTLQTANAFVLTTENNIEAAKHLLENHHFNYILPAVNSQDPVEKFFGQARQRCGGNFYIDIVDVMGVAKMQVLHQLLNIICCQIKVIHTSVLAARKK